MRPIIEALDALQSQGLIQAYAIGGAVAATFYLEPVATVDVDVFVTLAGAVGSLVDPTPIFRFLQSRGYSMQGECVLIEGWPVQLFASGNPLVEEAVAMAATMDVEGAEVRVFTPEHLAAICLQTGRAKDKLRLLQFIEEAAIRAPEFLGLVGRHGLMDRWETFRSDFLGEQNDF